MNLLGPDFSQARYWTEFDERGERLVMPIGRGWKAVGAALAGFAFAIIKMHGVFDHEPGPFEYAAFAALIGGALYLVLNILTSLLAREVIQIRGSELIHGWRLLGLKREKRYLLSGIYDLAIRSKEDSASFDKLVSPLKDFGKAGVVSFGFRGDTVGLGVGLDEAHGQQVIDWIARRVPRGVLPA